MTSLPFSSATELVAQIKKKKIGSEELLDLYLARIEKYQPQTQRHHCDGYLRRARRRAKLADAAIAKGEDWGPLHGLPVTIKDSFDLAGLPATWGVPELKDHRPANNAFTVQRYLDAGAIAFGKTNVSAYLIGWRHDQRDLRHDEQSLGPRAIAGRLVGRFAARRLRLD